MRLLIARTRDGILEKDVDTLCHECWSRGEGADPTWRAIGTPDDWTDPTQVLAYDSGEILAQFRAVIEKMSNEAPTRTRRRATNRHRPPATP